MNILVTAASQQGATTGIAESIGHTLRARGLKATIAAPNEIADVDAYSAFVIGSAIYMGHWLEPSVAFVRCFAPELSQRPVWLFSSGPVGDPKRELVKKMTSDPIELPELRALTNARDHRIFAGRLDGARLSGLQRLSLLAFRGMDGDWRDWAAVEDWAVEIADALEASLVDG